MEQESFTRLDVRSLMRLDRVALIKSSARKPTNGAGSTIRRLLSACLVVLGDILILAGGLGGSMLSTVLALLMLDATYGTSSLDQWNREMWIGLLASSLVAPTALIILSKRLRRPILAFSGVLGMSVSLVCIWFLYGLAHFSLG